MFFLFADQPTARTESLPTTCRLPFYYLPSFYNMYIIYTYIYNIHIIEENPQKTHPLAVPYPPPKTETESRKKIKKIQKIFKIYFLALFKNKTNLYPFPLSNSLTKPEISGFCVNVDLIKKLYNYIVSNKKTYSVI